MASDTLADRIRRGTLTRADLRSLIGGDGADHLDVWRGVRTRIAQVPDLRVERRAEGGAPRILGHASVFDQWTTLYEGRYWVMRECVRAGAYANAIKEAQDVRALFNHSADYVLGRTASGTLKLSEDRVGLWTETEAPDTQTIRDLVIGPIERKDITGMSFAFEVRRSDKQVVTNAGGVTVIDNGGERITVRMEGEKEIQERELLDLNLFDVSPVTYPAYEGTDVQVRSLAERFDRPHRTPRRDRAARRLRLALAE